MRQARAAVAALLAVPGLAIAACGASTATTTTTPPPSGQSTSSGGNGGGGQAANITVQVNFSGTDTVQGSFTTDEWNIYTCSDFAKSAFAWNLGLGPMEGAPTTVNGKLVNFLLSVQTGSFHGPGTYSDVMPAGVTVESDDYSGSTSTMTINADGSGNASFTNLAGSGNVAGQSESGTVTWTCS